MRPFLFLVGGQTSISSAGGAISGGAVTASTEYIVSADRGWRVN